MAKMYLGARNLLLWWLSSSEKIVSACRRVSHWLVSRCRVVVLSCCLVVSSSCRLVYRISLIHPCSLLAATRGRVLPWPLPRTGRHVGPTHPAHAAHAAHAVHPAVVIHGVLVRRIQQVGKR